VGVGLTAGLAAAGEPWLTLAGGAVLVGVGVGLGVTGRPWIPEGGRRDAGGPAVGAGAGAPEARTQRDPGPAPEPSFPYPILPDPILGEVVELPGGEFWMGTRDNDPRGNDDARPRHHVRVGPMRIGRTLVTVGQWNRVFPAQPREGEADLPVTRVTWEDALRFCAEASRIAGVEPAWSGSIDKVQAFGPGYRLPTEAEWEYACRAGTETAWSFGDDEALLGVYAWYAENAEGRVHAVAQRRPNPWGLYDMHGNVWEWCADGWDPAAYRKRVSTERVDGVDRIVDNPLVSAGSGRVVRGGSFVRTSLLTRSALRLGWHPSYEFEYQGFRCVLASRPQLSLFSA
jgi:formylglycine-generating enzyme required for sulfatase activity